MNFVCDVACCVHSNGGTVHSFWLYCCKHNLFFFFLLLRFEGVLFCTHASSVLSPYIFSQSNESAKIAIHFNCNCCSDWQATKKENRKKMTEERERERRKTLSTYINSNKMKSSVKSIEPIYLKYNIFLLWVVLHSKFLWTERISPQFQLLSITQIRRTQT